MFCQLPLPGQLIFCSGQTRARLLSFFAILRNWANFFVESSDSLLWTKNFCRIDANSEFGQKDVGWHGPIPRQGSGIFSDRTKIRSQNPEIRPDPLSKKPKPGRRAKELDQNVFFANSDKIRGQPGSGKPSFARLHGVPRCGKVRIVFSQNRIRRNTNG